MLIYNDIFNTLIIVFIYLFVYNISIILLFWTIFQFINLRFKTIYSFSDLRFNFFTLSSITILFFSLAGVPPFLGFFSKILILVSIINSKFFIIIFFFFSLLFLGLYFYLQNIRFLYHNNNTILEYYHLFNQKINITFMYYAYFLLFFIIFGFIYFDDFFLYFLWLLY